MGSKSSKRKGSSPTHLAPVVITSSSTQASPQPSSPPTGLWEWADDHGGYQAYDAAATAILEAAYAAGSSSVTLTVGNHSYNVDLSGLQQTNSATGFSRAVRRNVAFAATTSASSSASFSSGSSAAASTTSSNPTWEFEIEEGGEWESYDKLTTRLLEGSLTNGRANVVLNHGSFAVPGGYMVDFAAMTQTRQSTQEAVRVRRNPSIDPSLYPAVAKALAKASAATSDQQEDKKQQTDEHSSKSSGDRAFNGAGLDALREVAKLTKWARVTEQLIPEETCPVCLCEFEQPGDNGQEEEEEYKGKGKEQQPPQGEGEKKDAEGPPPSHAMSATMPEKCQPKPVEDEEDDVVVRLSQCQGHYFHRDCIVHCYKSGFLQCPICNVVYGVRIGTMPPGTMNVSTSGPSLSGYEGCGTIQIDYYFSSGTQGPEHPNPGMSYGGTSRTAYLPDNEEGREILALFKIAWERRLLFTVGRSVTTGEDNQVVWGGIHHKTSTSGGPTSFGYPDPTYFERVKAELAAKGVTLDG